MDIFFSSKRDLWSDIEKALGEYDETAIYEYCRPEEVSDDELEHHTRTLAAREDSPDWIFKPVLDEFLVAFRNWVDSIDISPAKPDINLKPNSRYLTFNYTETLEKIYGIPPRNILHIHGSRVVKGSDYIIGHNNIRPAIRHASPTDYFGVDQTTKNKIIHWMNDLHKDTTRIIHRNDPFFRSLNTIKHVEVIGHSLHEVDWPYFEKVHNSVDPHAQWNFHYHTDSDKMRILEFCEHCGVKEYKFEGDEDSSR